MTNYSLLEDIYLLEKVNIVTNVVKRSARDDEETNVMIVGKLLAEDPDFIHIGPDEMNVTHSVNKNSILLISKASAEGEEVIYDADGSPTH